MNAVELSSPDISSFQTFVLRFYTKHGRHELPWRQTDDPYKILVSELMLQQTQVARVIPKYLNFIAAFPNISSLAKASLSEVLSLWQGLGYNRRAKYLLQLAHLLSKSNKKQPFPTTEIKLQQLPGIGPYTASAIMSFAYNQPTTVIETNIRTVFLHHFFAHKTKITDKQLITIIEQCIPKTNPKEWYWALMDYGSYLKKILPNPSRKSKHHTKQSKFKGSLRQVRGEIIRLLVQQKSGKNGYTKNELKAKITGNSIHFKDALDQLIAEKLVVKVGNKVTLP